MLNLYSFFHLNLAFSSVEEDLRPEIVQRCYWPLLRLIREQSLPLAIEASGYTLEVIHQIDPQWIAELRDLCQNGPAEFIGSGYAQMIGPLVPAAVNHANQRLGCQVYRELLGFQPRLVLVNEQAYSGGLVEIYRAAGYRALIMEWDNPSSAHPEWDPNWRYLPQYACGPDGSRLPVIWNKSIPFQKFQRYTHGEIDLPEYLEYLGSRVGDSERAFALYGNDAEIFDFRPGRFNTEAVLGRTSEWGRIARLYKAVQADPRFRLIQPSQVLDFLNLPGGGRNLRLESAAQPVAVKKQPKYNITRWAVTGRDDLGLNTACWRLFESLIETNGTEEDWKELCYLWSSDFRTHITARRWQKLQQRLARMQSRIPAAVNPPARMQKVSRGDGRIRVRRERAFLEIETDCHRLRLNCRRGLAVEGWWDKSLNGKPLLRTLPHGYFDDIFYGADFYNGHFVLEIPGQHKITDLCEVSPDWRVEQGRLTVTAEISTKLGPVHKEITFDENRAEIEIIHHFRWPVCPNGTLRLGHITLNPEVFSRDSLFYRTHNGGESAETFKLNAPVNHLTPVSALVSASHGVGMTSKYIEIGDAERLLKIEVDKASAAVTGHIAFAEVDDRYFARLVFSASEMDDTCSHLPQRSTFEDLRVACRIGSSPHTSNLEKRCVL